MTVIVAVFWLSASAAWANGVINLKYIADPNSWIFRNTNLVKIYSNMWGGAGSGGVGQMNP